jgi:hypothetical protein
MLPAMGTGLIKARNAARAAAGGFLASAVMIGIVVAIEVFYYREFNPGTVLMWSTLIVAVFGYFSWKEYRWLNSVDGVGPDVDPP